MKFTFAEASFYIALDCLVDTINAQRLN